MLPQSSSLSVLTLFSGKKYFINDINPRVSLYAWEMLLSQFSVSLYYFVQHFVMYVYFHGNHAHLSNYINLISLDLSAGAIPHSTRTCWKLISHEHEQRESNTIKTSARHQHSAISLHFSVHSFVGTCT